MVKRRLLITNVPLTNQFPEKIDIELVTIQSERPLFQKLWALVKAYRKADAVMILNADALHALAAGIAKMLTRSPPLVLFYDTNLKRPHGLNENVKAYVKSILFRSVDKFIAMHKRWDEYEKFYGIPKVKFEYIPFKSNNFDRLQQIAVNDEGYIFSGGASYRDYDCLLQAVQEIDFPVKIVLPPARLARYHNTPDFTDELPPHVSVIRHDGTQDSWDRLIANSTLVVIPILKDCIQPAGISVYLEAMALGKPVIISRGASTDGLLDDSMSSLFTAGDAKELNQHILEMLRSPERRRRIAGNGQRYAISLEGGMRLSRDLQAITIKLLHGDAADTQLSAEETRKSSI
jgi:glycosyltransferase involved in cell wall biosynthesis